MELYNLEDCATELVLKADSVGKLNGFNVKELIDRLTPPVDDNNFSYAQYVKYIKKQGPPRYINGQRISNEKFKRLIKKPK